MVVLFFISRPSVPLITPSADLPLFLGEPLDNSPAKAVLPQLQPRPPPKPPKKFIPVARGSSEFGVTLPPPRAESPVNQPVQVIHPVWNVPPLPSREGRDLAVGLSKVCWPFVQTKP